MNNDKAIYISQHRNTNQQTITAMEHRTLIKNPLLASAVIVAALEKNLYG